MNCNNVAVMRRRNDSYLNATQILKVAEFDKPQRTRILEKEVQTGQHEKVQGGYGKYQGTWVPFERGVALAEHYHVDNVLRPIFDFVKGDQSPPLAPKHVTAASSRPRKIRTTEPKRKKVAVKAMELEPMEGDVSGFSLYELTQDNKKRNRSMMEESDQEDSGHTYAQRLLQYFISDDSGIPSLLLRPPSDLDVNVIIDDEGHTSLHWAAAMGRLKLVSLLIELGADIYRVNYKGQTALMRSVLFTNNFDSKSFLYLIDMLKKTIFNIDKKDQTVFHHVSATASWKGKVHASRYYMECLIETLLSNRSELISILNVQDVYGDTALSIAARIGNKKLVRLLMEAGASLEISNEEGMTAQDYLSEVERNNRFQPTLMHPRSPTLSQGEMYPYPYPPFNTIAASTATATAIATAATNPSTLASISARTDIHARSKLRNTVESLCKKFIITDRSEPPVVSQLFDNFTGNYERELIQKEHMIKEKRNELNTAKKRLLGTQHTFDQIQFDPIQLELIENEAKRLAWLLKKQSILLQKESLTQFISQYKNEEEEEEDNSHSDHVDDVEGLLTKLKELQQNRKIQTEKLMKLRLQTPSQRHQEYKRLISMCCNVSYENVDLMLLPLLSSFDQLGQQSSSS
ncbi:ankyrin repeat-containing domain protein [Pilaira anomala]|nr:ankyrin repeat-containing domain protein [Pilaira anomala]